MSWAMAAAKLVAMVANRVAGSNKLNGKRQAKSGLGVTNGYQAVTISAEFLKFR